MQHSRAPSAASVTSAHGARAKGCAAVACARGPRRGGRGARARARGGPRGPCGGHSCLRALPCKAGAARAPQHGDRRHARGAVSRRAPQTRGVRARKACRARRRGDLFLPRASSVLSNFPRCALLPPPPTPQPTPQPPWRATPTLTHTHVILWDQSVARWAREAVTGPLRALPAQPLRRASSVPCAAAVARRTP